MTSYQKLKAKVKELEGKLMTVCNEPESEQAFLIKMDYIMRKRTAYTVWAGSVDKRFSRFTGIIHQISDT